MNKVISRNLSSSISRLTVSSLQFNLFASERIILGPDEIKGDRWRGGLGEALKGFSCLHRWEAETDCRACDDSPGCFFFSFFANDLPHPFVLSPELDSREVYQRGEPFSLGITLIGTAVAHESRIIRAMEELGRLGIGNRRGRFVIHDVRTSLIDFRSFLNNTDTPQAETYLELLTPVKIKEEVRGLYYSDLPFETFFRILLKRIINLNNLYGNGRSFDKEEIEQEKRGLLEAAREIKTGGFTDWRDYNRTSSRQQKSIKIGGQTGMVRLTGDLTPFMPYLRIGEVLGVGLHTTSGFGRYRVHGKLPQLLDQPIEEEER